LGCLVKIIKRQGKVLLNTRTSVFVDGAQVVPGGVITGIAGTVQPIESSRGIHGTALAFNVKSPEGIHGHGVTLLG